jgi:hypothetical protein
LRAFIDKRPQTIRSRVCVPKILALARKHKDASLTLLKNQGFTEKASLESSELYADPFADNDPVYLEYYLAAVSVKDLEPVINFVPLFAVG